MKKLLAVLLIMLLPITNLYQAKRDGFTIEDSNRVKNIEPGYCAWCSIEMIGRQRGIKSLINLSKNRASDDDLTISYKGRWTFPRNVGSEIPLQIKLNELGVKWKMQWTGNYDTDLIEYAMDNRLGCVIAVRPETLASETHAVVLTKYDDNSVEIVDPNFISATLTIKRSWFDKSWNGFILVIDKQ